MVTVACFLPGRAKDLPAPWYTYLYHCCHTGAQYDKKKCARHRLLWNRCCNEAFSDVMLWYWASGSYCFKRSQHLRFQRSSHPRKIMNNLYWICLFACLTLQIIHYVPSKVCEQLTQQHGATSFIFFTGIKSLQLNQCLLQNDGPIKKSSDFSLHLLTPTDFRSFSIQSNHFNFGPPAFLHPSGFPRNTFRTT